MPGARCARSLACEMKKAHEHSHHGHTGNTRHSPRNGFNGYFVLSPVTGLSCHRRYADCSAKLDASVGASGPHDFAVREATSLVADIARVHRIPHPTSVTIAQTPLLRGTGYCRYGFDLGVRSMPPVAADWHDGQFAHDKHAIADHRAG
jgi:hypothetical protein